MNLQSPETEQDRSPEPAPAFTPWDPEVFRDPYPMWAALREHDPVHRFEPVSGWVVTRYEDCCDILRDDRFSARIHDSTFEQTQRHQFADPERQEAIDEFFGRSLLFSHGTRHRQLRESVREHFSPAALRRFEPQLQKIAEELVAQLPTGEPFDFVARYADVLPLRAICALCGIPIDDEARLKSLVAGVGPLMDIVKSPEQRDAAVDSLVALRRLVRELAADRRFRARSVADALTRPGTEGAAEEAVGMLSLLLVTGSETTCNLLSALAFHLGRDQERFRHLQRGGAAASEDFVHEVLQLYPPVVGVARVATQDVLFRDKEIKRGDYVIVAIASANRDQRSAGNRRSDHLSFGFGEHRCLGATLGLAQARESLRCLLERSASIRTESEPGLKPTQVLRGFDSLRCRVDTKPVTA